VWGRTAGRDSVWIAVARLHAGIKAIKLYAWEEPFKKRIEALRAAELHEIRHVTERRDAQHEHYVYLGARATDDDSALVMDS